jgi:hypothetical protein
MGFESWHLRSVPILQWPTAYSSDPACNAAVRVVADWWEELAGYLYEIATMAKGQKKIDDHASTHSRKML